MYQFTGVKYGVQGGNRNMQKLVQLNGLLELLIYGEVYIFYKDKIFLHT